jgi:phosphoribosylformylglycinamidine synthase
LPNATFPGIGLSDDEIRLIAERLGREPTLVELHAFDAQWSEHCSYKSSRVHLARLPTESPDVILGPGQDAGIVRLGEWEGETYGIVIAHESHNHPSQVVPFEGAATGVGGIVRDVLCMGARVIALADPLRFGPLDDPHSRYVAQGVVDGIAAYGNAIGVPTIAGDVYFHEGFKDNCLVNVVALGIVKEKEIIFSSAPAGSEGWDIVLIGKATDRSGFGGAAFSSLVLDEKDAEANKSAVQVPDPFLKNVIMRASYRAFDVIRDLGLTVGFKDLGAGGIMGCTAELVASGGYGARIELDRCPTSQPDLPPAVIAVGETQERLAWVVPPSFTPRLLQIYNEEFSLPEIARHACAAVIGTVTTEKDYVLTHHGEEVMNVPIDFLTAGVKYERAFERRTRIWPSVRDFDPVSEETALGTPAVRVQALLNMWDQRIPFDYDLPLKVLGHSDVSSRRTIYERYDSVVRGATSIPCGYADAGVIVPVAGAPFAVAVGLGGNPRYGVIDSRLAAEHAVCEAIRNVAAVGARPLGLTDCLNFGNPLEPAQMGDFVAAVEGLAVASRELAVPFVSGNVSLYNQASTGRSVPASPIVACVGVADDVSLVVSPKFKGPGHDLYFYGKFGSELGGSVLSEVRGLPRSRLESIDYDYVRAELEFIKRGLAAGAFLSVHDVSDGGVFVAVAEMAFGTHTEMRIGATIAFGTDIPWDSHVTGTTGRLFGESGGFIVEASQNCAGWLSSVLELDYAERDFRHNFQLWGRTTETYDLEVILEDGRCMTWGLDALYESWASPLQNFYEGVPA